MRAAYLIMLALFACAPAEAERRLSAEGFGPVRIGMTLPQASAALGVDISPTLYSEDPEACDIAMPEAGAYPGLSFLTTQGRISHVSLSPPDQGEVSAIETAEGVGIGEPGEAVRAAYPGAVREEQPYTGPPAYDLYVWVTPQRGMRFQIDESGRVVAIHAGADTIRVWEGCL